LPVVTDTSPATGACAVPVTVAVTTNAAFTGPVASVANVTTGGTRSAATTSCARALPLPAASRPASAASTTVTSPANPSSGRMRAA